MENNPPTYSLKVFCTNCDFDGEVQIPKGKPHENQKCPKCEVETLEKSMKVISMRPHIEDYGI